MLRDGEPRFRGEAPNYGRALLFCVKILGEPRNERKKAIWPAPPYTPEVGAAICERLAAGPSVAAPECPPLPPSGNGRLMTCRDSLRGTRARERYRPRYAGHEILDGTAKPEPEGVDLRIWLDARRWYLSKLAPKRYGDRIAQELSGAESAPLVPPKIEIVSVPTRKAVPTALSASDVIHTPPQLEASPGRPTRGRLTPLGTIPLSADCGCNTFLSGWIHVELIW